MRIKYLNRHFLRRSDDFRSNAHTFLREAEQTRQKNWELCVGKDSCQGLALFDRNGILKPRLKTGYRSGTGCWGDELNDDALAYIADITVKDEVSLAHLNCYCALIFSKYRRKGIGSLLLKGLRESEHKSQIATVVSWPFAKDDPGVNAFFVKVGSHFIDALLC